MQDIGRDREPVRAHVIGHTDDLRGVFPPVMVTLGLPARQRPAVLDEGTGVEIADAADVGIEGQEAAEAQVRRHMQLDQLLTVPARHGIEAAERAEEFALRADLDLDLGEMRQAGAQQGHIVAWRNDQHLERLAVTPVLGQRFDQQPGAFKIAPALQLAQSQRQDGLSDFGEHRARSECGSALTLINWYGWLTSG